MTAAHAAIPAPTTLSVGQAPTPTCPTDNVTFVRTILDRAYEGAVADLRYLGIVFDSVGTAYLMQAPRVDRIAVIESLVRERFGVAHAVDRPQPDEVTVPAVA